MTSPSFNRKIAEIQANIRKCRACSNVVGPPVHGSPIASRLFLLGQAPGPREASYGKPFAYTAGRTLFRWFNEAGGVDEEQFRENVYMAAVGRCFPGKAKGGADRVPDRDEIEACGTHIERELALLQPELAIAVGKLAISELLAGCSKAKTLGKNFKLTDVIGKPFRTKFRGWEGEVICLPHPSGLSSWHKVEPGITLTKKALRLIVRHPAWLEQFG